MKKNTAQVTFTVTTNSGRYSVIRRGSRYNIWGPEGRAFSKYESASMVGPRWEELTHIPWPHPSSAYAPGLRLGEVESDQPRGVEVDTAPGPSTPARKPYKSGPLAQVGDLHTEPTRCPLALPAPRIDVNRQARLIKQLRQQPDLLFHPDIQQALRYEIEYNLAYKRLAERLLGLLAHYERKQQRQRPDRVQPEIILARHIAWQEQQALIMARRQ